MHANLRTTYGDGAGVHFVVIFREPVDRAFSEHCMFTHGTPPPGSAPAERSGAPGESRAQPPRALSPGLPYTDAPPHPARP